MRSAALVAAFAAGLFLLPSAGTAQTATGTNLYNAPQTVDNSGLLRWIYNAPFPIQCPDASQFVRDLRSKPVSDPATMHKGMKLFEACGTGPYAKGHVQLYNLSVYAMSAAALLAARQEPPSQALSDAEFAKKGSAIVVSYSRDQYHPVSGPDPSAFRTNASQINKDATALIPAIHAHASATHAMPAVSPAGASVPAPTH